jgi:hypothetical protein
MQSTRKCSSRSASAFTRTARAASTTRHDGERNLIADKNHQTASEKPYNPLSRTAKIGFKRLIAKPKRRADARNAGGRITG